MDNKCMTEQEVESFAKPYKEKYGWQLMARSGNDSKSYDNYLYHFVDDARVCIIINPENKGFSFSKIVDWIFRLASEEFTPLDYSDHFEKNYLRFRKIVLEKQLN